MRYLGSKTMLLNEIAQIAASCTLNGIFCDPFGGIGTVGSFMKKQGYQIITGDILNFAHFFQTALIQADGPMDFLAVKQEHSFKDNDEIEQYMNAVTAADGWMIDEYAKKRKFFTIENARHIQGCINCIWNWKTRKILNELEYKVLLASLIQAFDKVANTAGTYYAYLKTYDRKALRPFRYTLIQPIKGKTGNYSFLIDANKLVETYACDILYLDPPYNERSYGKYYHLPETVAVGEIPHPQGRSGISAPYEIPSKYNKRIQAADAFEKIIQTAQAKYIIFHYTDHGLIPTETARDILKAKGCVDEFYFDSKGYHTTKEIGKCQHHIFRVIV